MTNADAASLGRIARQLDLVTDRQLSECFDELGEPSAEPAEDLLRLLERKAVLTPWQTQKLRKGDRDGYFLGGYRLLYRIAAGSFGRVFRADDPRTGRVVAIKVLRRRWTEKPDKVALFEREGKVGLTLKHPNIVQILAVSRDPLTSQHYLVMEFVEGGNLRDFLAIRKKLEPAEALRLLEETAAGLAHAYSRGLTHRDMKPTNILISATGAAKLVDFGLAELTGGSGGSDDPNVDRSVDYAGLEKATGVKAGDVRSDIFFLGCVFFEMLTGRPPLTATKDKHLRMARQRFDNLPTLSPDEVTAPRALFQLLDQMMAFDPLLRYQTPALLLDAVRQVRAEVDGRSAVPAFPAGPPTVFVVQRHPRLQDAIRAKFKELGFRVLMSVDPSRAVQKYKQEPFHAVAIDAGPGGREEVAACEAILREADLRGLLGAGILILSEEQADWAKELSPRPNRAVLVRPVTLKQLYTKLCELVPVAPRTPA